MSSQPSGRLARAIAGFHATTFHATWPARWALRIALMCLAVPMLVQAAQAQSVSARIEWYGTYAVSDSKTVDDPRSPTGRRLISTPIPPKSNTDQIPGRDGTRFGFSYVLSGSGGHDVTIRRIFRFPGDGMPNVSSGNKTRAYEDTQTYAVGDPILMGWSFEGAPPERILFGEWVLEVWVGNQKIVSKRFNVYQP